MVEILGGDIGLHEATSRGRGDWPRRHRCLLLVRHRGAIGSVHPTGGAEVVGRAVSGCKFLDQRGRVAGGRRRALKLAT